MEHTVIIVVVTYIWQEGFCFKLGVIVFIMIGYLDKQSVGSTSNDKSNAYSSYFKWSLICTCLKTNLKQQGEKQRKKRIKHAMIGT